MHSCWPRGENFVTPYVTHMITLHDLGAVYSYTTVLLVLSGSQYSMLQQRRGSCTIKNSPPPVAGLNRWRD